MTTSTYSIYTIYEPKYWFARDEFTEKNYLHKKEIIPSKGLWFHLSEGDYILTLVSILRFFEESLMNNEQKMDEKTRKTNLEAMKNVINDLLYISEHYSLKPKDKNTDK